MKAVTG